MSVTGILAAGRPMVVSRTWHVMGGLDEDSDMACGGGADGREVSRWWVIADRRALVGVGVGIRWVKARGEREWN